MLKKLVILLNYENRIAAYIDQYPLYRGVYGGADYEKSFSMFSGRLWRMGNIYLGLRAQKPEGSTKTLPRTAF